MTIDQITAFISLATTLNYTQTAEALHMTQPTVSKLIKALEDELGFGLFFRDTKRVTLTPAGIAFLTEAQAFNTQFNNLLFSAKEIRSGSIGHLNIGYVGHSVAECLPAIMNNFRQDNPQISLRMTDYRVADIAEALQSNEIDVALSDLYAVSNLPNVHSQPILTAKYHIIMNEKNPLASKEFLTIDDIRNEKFVMHKSTYISDLSATNRYHPLLRLSAEEHFVPQVSQIASTVANLLLLVDAGFGLAFVATHLKYTAPKSIKFVPLHGVRTHVFTGTISWKKTNKNPALGLFVDSASRAVGAKLD